MQKYYFWYDCDEDYVLVSKFKYLIFTYKNLFVTCNRHDVKVLHLLLSINMDVLFQTNKQYERDLRIVLNEHISDFETITSHHRNIQSLMTELFKTKYVLFYFIIPLFRIDLYLTLH